METNRWPFILAVIVLLALIYNFLNTIFRSDVKRFSHDRLYIDYASYKKKDTRKPSGSGSSPSPFLAPHMRNEFRQSFEGRLDDSVNAYQSYLQKALEKRPDIGAEPASVNSSYDEVMRLARQTPEGLGQARVFFAKGSYAAAVQEFQNVLATLQENDLQNRLSIHNALAECCFQQNIRIAYVEHKAKALELTQRLREMLRGSGGQASPLWMSVDEATQLLLKTRVHALQNLKGREKEDVIRRAEFDLEVARVLNR